MSMSGIDRTNNILISIAQVRVKAKIITQAEITGHKGSYHVIFTNKEAEWDGKPMILASSRNPYEPKIFKSLDGAMANVLRTGLTNACIKVTE